MSESQASSTRSTSSLEAGELAWEREQCLAEIEPMRRAAQPIMKIHKRITEAIKNGHFKKESVGSNNKCYSLLQAHELLGQNTTSEAASKAAIRQYRADTKSLHPDRMGRSTDAATRFMASKLYLTLTAAKEVVQNEKDLDTKELPIIDLDTFPAVAMDIAKQTIIWAGTDDDNTQADSSPHTQAHVKAWRQLTSAEQKLIAIGMTVGDTTASLQARTRLIQIMRNDNEDGERQSAYARELQKRNQREKEEQETAQRAAERNTARAAAAAAAEQAEQARRQRQMEEEQAAAQTAAEQAEQHRATEAAAAAVTAATAAAAAEAQENQRREREAATATANAAAAAQAEEVRQRTLTHRYILDIYTHTHTDTHTLTYTHTHSLSSTCPEDADLSVL
jgi:hypothetical protein